MQNGLKYLLILSFENLKLKFVKKGREVFYLKQTQIESKANKIERYNT